VGEYYSLFILGYDRELRFQQEKLKNGGQETQHSCPDPCFEMIIEI
jgi:hypothetical protein